MGSEAPVAYSCSCSLKNCVRSEQSHHGRVVQRGELGCGCVVDSASFNLSVRVEGDSEMADGNACHSRACRLHHTLTPCIATLHRQHMRSNTSKIIVQTTRKESDRKSAVSVVKSNFSWIEQHSSSVVRA